MNEYINHLFVQFPNSFLKIAEDMEEAEPSEAEVAKA